MMPLIITAEQVKEAALKAGLHEIECRECSICGFLMHYVVGPDSDLYYDSSCDCSRYTHPPRLVGWQGAADRINCQSGEEARAEVAARFGLKL